MLSSTAIEDDVRTLVKNKIILTIGSKEDIIIAEKIGKEENQTIRVHLKIRYRIWKIWICIFKKR